MMIMGILIFLIGLFLVFDYKHHGDSGFSLCNKADRAMDIVRERYARGEITAEEFTAMKNILG